MPDSPNDESPPAETEAVKASLRRLAGPDDERVIERAVAAVDDLERAVAFVESVGLPKLARAVESVDDPSVRERGEEVLETFRRYRRVAVGDQTATDHFHSHYRSDLNRDAQGASR